MNGDHTQAAPSQLLERLS